MNRIVIPPFFYHFFAIETWIQCTLGSATGINFEEDASDFLIFWSTYVSKIGERKKKLSFLKFPYGSLLFLLVSYGSLWFLMFPFGSLRLSNVPLGSLWFVGIFRILVLSGSLDWRVFTLVHKNFNI